MSRTRRNIPPRLRMCEYETRFILRLEHGLVDIPIATTLKDGRHGGGEIWGPNMKKFAKKLRARAARRSGKELSSEDR